MRKERQIKLIALFIIELMLLLPVAFSASAAQTTNQTAGNVTQPAISLDVTLPSYSRQKSLTVEGTTASGAKIEYYIGPTKVKVGRARPDGTFKTLGVPLIKKGDNNLMVKAVVDGQSAQKTFTIRFDPTPPVLNVSDVPGFTTSRTVKIKGDVSEPSTIKYTSYTKKDDIAPGTVVGLEVREVKKNQATLVWDISPEEDFYEYAVYRDGKRVGTARTPVFIDTGVASDVEYSYQVSAVDSSCNEGPKSSPKKATTEKGGETEEKDAVVELSCAPVYNTMQTAVPFELTFNLEAGKNIIEIIAEDEAGNSARIEKEVVLDIGPPQFVTTNIDQLGTTYIPDITVKGNLSEKGTVFVYLNDESKPSHFELTDDDGHFEIPVKLKQDIKIETGTAAELDTGIGWKNKIKLKAVDLAGQEAWYPGQQKNAEVTWAICGYGSWFDFDPETITPSMLTPRLLMQGIQQIGVPFTLKYIGGQQGVEINGLVNAVPVRLNPEMSEFFDNDKISAPKVYLNKRPGKTDTWDGYVQVKFAPWPVDSLDLEGNTTPAAIEEAISSWRRGEEPKAGLGFGGVNPYFVPGCPSYPVLGCAKLYLEIDIPVKEKVSIVDQKTGKERIEYKTSRQRNCLPITIDIDQVIPPDVIRKDSLEATSHFFSQAIELIDEVLDPLTTFTENVVYLCMGGAAALFLAGLLKRFFCSSLMLKSKGVDADVAQAGLCDIAYADDESANSRCDKCEWLTKTYNNVLQDVYQPVCDRIGCPSAPTVQKYIKEKRGTPKDITLKISDKPAKEGEQSPRQKAIAEWGVFGRVYSGSGCGFSGASKRVPDVISPTYAVEKVKGAVHIRGKRREGQNCASDDICDPGLYCDPFKGTCEIKIDEEKIPLHSVQAGGDCKKDEDCAGGLICNVFKKCIEKPKEIAKNSVGEGGYCEKDDHCVEGLKCDTMFKSECYDPEKIPEIEPGSVSAGGECYKKEDCKKGLECSELYGTCYDPLAKAPGSVGPGGGCDKDSDCALDLECRNSKCTGKEECKKDTDCPTHQWCHEDGYCFTPSRQGQWCENDDYCEADFKCKDNVCVYAPGVEEIKPGTVKEGGSCDKDEDCVNGLKCDIFDKVCYKPSEEPVLAKEGEKCYSDSDCGYINPEQPVLGRLQCHTFRNVCFKPSGLNEACSFDADCRYGWICKDSKCVAEECQKDSDCPSGYACDPASKYCYYVRKEGDACITDDVCGEGMKCVSGFCKVIPVAPKKAGEPCSDDSDCMAGLYCHTKDDICFAPAKEGSACRYQEDCAAGLSCHPTSKKCFNVCADDADCGKNKDGKQLFCSRTLNICFLPAKMCEKDADCPSGQFCHSTGKFCFTPGGINYTCFTADDCELDLACVDGKCKYVQSEGSSPTGSSIFDVVGAFSTGAAVASGIGGSTAGAEETSASRTEDPYVCGYNLRTEFGLPDKVGLKDLYEIYLEEDNYKEIAKMCRNSSLHPACPLCCGIDYMWKWNSACGVGNFLGISNNVLDIDTFDELKNSVKLAAEKVGKGDEVAGFNLWNFLSGFCSAEGNPTPEVVRTGLNFNPKISEAESNMLQVFVFPNPSVGGENFKYTIFRGYIAKTYKIEGAVKEGRKTYREDEMYKFSSTMTAIKDLELTQYFKDLGTPKEKSQFNSFKSAFCKNVGKSKLEGKKCDVAAKEVWEKVKNHVGYVDQEYIIKPNSGIVNSIRCICLPAIISYLKKWRQISVAIKNCVDMIRLTGDGSEGSCRSKLSTYVCDLLWEVISCFVNKWSSPSGKRISVASGIADLVGVVTGAGKDVSNEVEGRYGESAAFNAMFNEKQLVHGLCMMAFGFEWNVDIAAMAQQSVESVPVETIVLGPMPCERRFLSWNPQTNPRGLTTWEYHFGLMAAAGADINTRVKLKCSEGFGCSEADGFVGGECDCNKLEPDKDGKRAQEITINPVCKPAWKSRVNKDELLNVDCSYVTQHANYRFDTLIFEYDWENPSTKQRETKKSECKMIQFGSDPPAFCKFDIFSNRFRCQFGESPSGIKIEKVEPKYENAIKEGKFKGKQVFALDEDLKFQLSIKQMMPESIEEQDVEIIDAAGWRNYFAKTASSGDRYNFEIWASGETALKLKIEENLDDYLGDVDIRYTEDGAPGVPTQ